MFLWRETWAAGFSGNRTQRTQVNLPGEREGKRESQSVCQECVLLLVNLNWTFWLFPFFSPSFFHPLCPVLLQICRAVDQSDGHSTWRFGGAAARRTLTHWELLCDGARLEYSVNFLSAEITSCRRSLCCLCSFLVSWISSVRTIVSLCWSYTVLDTLKCHIFMDSFQPSPINDRAH